MRYTDLIFDLYGTLVDIHTDVNDLVWEKTALFYGFYGASYTGPELKAAFEEGIALRQAKAGQSYECFPDIPFEEVMAQLFREKGIHENADMLGFQASQLNRICAIDYVKLYPHVPEALERLRNAGCRLWLLSNAQRSFTAYELRLLELDGQFDRMYLSSDYRCRKPDSRFFRLLLEEQQLDVTKCLMIGNDRDTDIAGAVAMGLDSLYMHTALTPAGQAPADPALLPGKAPDGCRHYEYEGDDWETLTALLLDLIK